MHALHVVVNHGLHSKDSEIRNQKTSKLSNKIIKRCKRKKPQISQKILPSPISPVLVTSMILSITAST